MPTYEYRCKECGHELEIQQSFTDDALTECPVCHGSLRKLFGSVGISFKGSGFYKNDHGARSKASSSSASTSSDSSSSSSDSSSSSSSSSDSSSSSSSTKSESAA
jgi:putative FmdB family regulatory protein